MNKKMLAQIAMVLCLISGAATSQAQNLNFLRESPIAWLDDNDEAILRATIDAVLEAPDGTATDWQNPATGANGRVQVVDTHEAFGTTCRRLTMRNEARGRKGGGTYRLCLAKDGNWKFAANDDPAGAAATPAQN